ncbi:hypothetical protein KC19_VG184000 [Ceratodon purpureus]|uniref:Uncharacterized protein n=1 Tax=Ceratodon purpureus TaxID=3225 RepID=A0A8T0HSI9_CERPU|nr:hypothetical protein KC19_VG184000 [Ceratodon purpureus]
MGGVSGDNPIIDRGLQNYSLCRMSWSGSTHALVRRSCSSSLVLNLAHMSIHIVLGLVRHSQGDSSSSDEGVARSPSRWLPRRSKCIFESDEKHPLGSGIGFKEEDTPNFARSCYSKMKAMMEDLLKELDNVCTLRVRMPICRTNATSSCPTCRTHATRIYRFTPNRT